MSEAPRRSHFDTRFQQLEDELRYIKSEIVADASGRLEGKGITEADGDEYVMGVGYLTAAIERLLAEADYIFKYAPGGKQDVLRMLPHARALIASALIVGRHSGTTETAKRLLRGEQTKQARNTNTSARDERLEFSRFIIETAKRKSNGNLLDPEGVRKKINDALLAARDDHGNPPHEIIGDEKTVRRYAKRIFSEETP